MKQNYSNKKLSCVQLVHVSLCARLNSRHNLIVESGEELAPFLGITMHGLSAKITLHIHIINNIYIIAVIAGLETKLKQQGHVENRCL